jgi:hypothetical protein
MNLNHLYNNPKYVFNSYDLSMYDYSDYPEKIRAYAIHNQLMWMVAYLYHDDFIFTGEYDWGQPYNMIGCGARGYVILFSCN